MICAATALFDSRRRLLHRYTCWWALHYLRCLPGCRIQVEGADRLQPDTAYVLVANHQSMTDIMALSALPISFKWVSKKEAFRLPCIGWNMYLNQYIIVDRGNIRNVRATMELCRAWLERDVPLLIFPEGHRSRTGEMIEFHNGAFRLAASSDCPVVPIVVHGTLPIYQGFRVLPRPGKITIRILNPVTLKDTNGNVERLRTLVFARMQRELNDIRGERQATFSRDAQRSAG
jgi:1-acyl-sn-glycerol-3-phosphate acyltransferase